MTLHAQEFARWWRIISYTFRLVVVLCCVPHGTGLNYGHCSPIPNSCFRPALLPQTIGDGRCGQPLCTQKHTEPYLGPGQQVGQKLAFQIFDWPLALCMNIFAYFKHTYLWWPTTPRAAVRSCQLRSFANTTWSFRERGGSLSFVMELFLPLLMEVYSPWNMYAGMGAPFVRMTVKQNLLLSQAHPPYNEVNGFELNIGIAANSSYLTIEWICFAYIWILVLLLAKCPVNYTVLVKRDNIVA